MVLSLGLIAVVLLAVIGLFSSAIRLQGQSQERSAATDAGRRLMERIRSEPNVVPNAPAAWIGGELAYTPFDVGPPTFPPSPYPYENGYSFDVYLDLTPRPGLKSVKVVVRWDDDHGKKLVLQTLIRN